MVLEFENPLVFEGAAAGVGWALSSHWLHGSPVRIPPREGRPPER